MISVVTPCYNAENFVARAIESVLVQDYQNWELILVDNNSTDNTMGVLLDYQKKYPDKIKVYQEVKKGGPAARNHGLYKAKGKWIQFLDADDALLPGKFSRQVLLATQSEADIIAGRFARIVSIKGFTLKSVKALHDKDVWKALITAQLGITSANLFSKEKVLLVNGWDESLSSSQEYDLMFRLLINGSKVGFDKTAVAAHVYYEGNSVSRSKSTHRNVQVTENYVNLRLRIKSYLKNANLLSKELNDTIEAYIYAYLQDKKYLAPQYITNKMEELGITPPFKVRMKQIFRGIVKRLL